MDEDLDKTLAAAPTPGFAGMETIPGDAQAGGANPHAPATGPATHGKIGRFDVLRVLGQGGMGRVYTAYDEQLDRRVAIKVLRRDVARPRARSGG